MSQSAVGVVFHYAQNVGPNQPCAASLLLSACIRDRGAVCWHGVTPRRGGQGAPGRGSVVVGQDCRGKRAGGGVGMNLRAATP